MPNALSLYRLARLAHRHGVPLVPTVLKGAIFVLYNSIVPFQATIGPCCKLAHGGIGVVIHPDVRIGRNVLIGQGVTIGGRSRRPGVPRIGDNIYIGAGARILGDLSVGSGSIVAANAVVTTDVPPRTIVAGVPARVVREEIDVTQFENLPAPICPQPDDGEGRGPRVLFVSGMYPSPGRPHWGSFIASQAESLRAAGARVDLISPQRGPAPCRYLSGSAQVLLRTALRRYDVVHAHFGLWGWAARLQARTPVVMSFCGDDLLGRPDGHGGKTWKSRLVVQAGKLLAPRVDAVIVKSQEMAGVLGGVACHVIANGVNFDDFAPMDQQEARRSLDLNPDGCYALFVANPKERRKRHDLAMAAVGTASKQIDGGLTLLTVHGQPKDVVARYMNAADVLILTSDWEGSPNVVKEAMACNLPVVGVPVGDVVDLIGRTEGCRVATADVAALAAGLVYAASPRRRTKGRADIAHLEVGAVAQRLLGIYGEVARRAKRAPAAAQLVKG